ncbi:hypothetical protein SLEP1_g6043 [Rubroshorea leprosula]|uniref:Uncharacterized protein n=1 Tax=Rubroshorea leprosula TaxID=152421 RepID=A0AAV5HZR6_9ROSI|nr:hypothetical protein SLEP1_g6043 [Rubroshorea leprosula]
MGILERKGPGVKNLGEHKHLTLHFSKISNLDVSKRTPLYIWNSLNPTSLFLFMLKKKD